MVLRSIRTYEQGLSDAQAAVLPLIVDRSSARATVYAIQNNRWQGAGDAGFEVFCPHGATRWQYHEFQNMGAGMYHWLRNHYSVEVCEGSYIWPGGPGWVDGGSWTAGTAAVSSNRVWRQSDSGATAGRYVDVTVPAGSTHLYAHLRSSGAQALIGVTIVSGGCTLVPSVAQYETDTYDGLINTDNNTDNAIEGVTALRNNLGIYSNGINDDATVTLASRKPAQFVGPVLLATGFTGETVLRLTVLDPTGAEGPRAMVVYGFIALDATSPTTPDLGVIRPDTVIEITKGYAIGSGCMFYVSHDELSGTSAVGEGHLGTPTYDGVLGGSIVELVRLSDGTVWFNSVGLGEATEMQVLDADDVAIVASGYGLARELSATLTLGNKDDSGADVFNAGSIAFSWMIESTGYQSSTRYVQGATGAAKHVTLATVNGYGPTSGWCQWTVSPLFAYLLTIPGADRIAVGNEVADFNNSALFSGAPAPCILYEGPQGLAIMQGQFIVFSDEARQLAHSTNCNVLMDSATLGVKTYMHFGGQGAIALAEGDEVVMAQQRILFGPLE